MVELDDLLQTLIERDGSDLHLRAGEPPVLRIHGVLQRTGLPALTADDTKSLIAAILSDNLRARFAERQELEMSHATDFARFRVNVFRQQGQVGAVFRLIPLFIRSLDELMLPPVAHDLCLRPRGLLLVTGAAGSGKSTTLASLIDHINARRRVHIITVEDPIEYVHVDKLASVDQREVGQDTSSSVAALRHARRQNPDVLVIDDLREAETVELALAAAQTGRLVLATAQTADAAQTIDRFLQMFPHEHQRPLCLQLAATLIGVVSQTLLPRLDTVGRVAAYEMMVTIPAIRTLIRDGKTQQIPAEIQTGSQYGMESLDHSLAALVRRRMVRYEDALARAVNPRDFEQRSGALSQNHQ